MWGMPLQGRRSQGVGTRGAWQASKAHGTQKLRPTPSNPLSLRTQIYGILHKEPMKPKFARSLFECLPPWVLQPAAEHVERLVDWPNVHIACVLILKQRLWQQGQRQR